MSENNELEIHRRRSRYLFVDILKKIMNFVLSMKNSFDEWVDKKERIIQLRKFIEIANTYEEWQKHAKDLDNVEEKEKWKLKIQSTLYDYKEVAKLVKTLKKKREMKDIRGIVHYIRTNLMKNLYSTLNPVLYNMCNYGTKYLIQDFQNEMIKSLEYISNFNEKVFPLHKKLEFFSETRHAYGRTALLLSGGASLGIFHIGVIKTLYEQNLLPRIICGSSAGSMIAAMVCTQLYEDVPTLIEKEMKIGIFEFKFKEFAFLKKLFSYITRGVLFDVDVLKDFLMEHIGSMTFQEAFDKTGWILNITVTGYKEHDNHRLLNYLTAPNVLIWSAVCASCCVPGMFDPVELLCKNEYGHKVPYSSKNKFIDGSISADLPMQRLSELFNVNMFIVSQTNPWVIPFLDKEDVVEIYNRERQRFNLWKLIKSLIFGEIKHRFLQIKSLGILPNIVTRWFNIITQDYRGHVTIFPVPKIMDYLKLISNPDKSHILESIKHSSKRTFPKMCFIESILKFEFALEKFHRKLKQRINKINFNTDKKYEMEDEEAFDDYNTNLILLNSHLYNKAEGNLLNSNLQDIINIKTENLSSSSINDIGANLINLNKNNGSSPEELEIIDKYNNIIFYNQENRIKVHSEKKNADNRRDDVREKDLNLNNLELSDSFSHISPLISHCNLKREKFKKNSKKTQIKYNGNKIFFQRHDSFLIPRSNSKIDNKFC